MSGINVVYRAAAVLLCAIPMLAGATNGYFAHGFSAAQKALGGAGTALPEDALIGSINPAGMVWMGDSVDVNLSMFTPIRDYQARERGVSAEQGIVTLSPIAENRSHNEYYPLPALGYNRRWGERASWGVTMFGNGGLNTEYNESITTVFAQNFRAPANLDAVLGPLVGGAVPLNLEEECEGSLGGGAIVRGPGNFCGEEGGKRSGVDLAILFVAPTLSYKIGERSSVGISVLGALSRFAAQGLGAFKQFSNAPDKVTNNGHDIAVGGGYRIGVLTGVIPFVNLGASYQSRVWMGEFDDYRGLFAKQGDFDVPETWNLGVAVQLTSDLQLVADYQRINYSDIRSVGNPFDPNDFVNNCAIPRLFARLGFGGSTEPSDSCLGATVGPGFGWQDMEVYKFGLQYTRGDHKFRVGYSQTDQPIPSTEILFNTLAPGVIEQHFTAGMSLRWRMNLFVELALMYAPLKQVTGKNPLSNTEANFGDLIGQAIPVPGLGALLGGSGTDLATAFGPDPDDQDIRIQMRQYELTVGLAWRF